MGEEIATAQNIPKLETVYAIGYVLLIVLVEVMFPPSLI